MNGKIYKFEGFLLDVAEQRLQKDGLDISLPPKVFEVLTALIKKHGQLVTYQELMDEVWPDTFVEETNLRYSIHTLRKTFPENFIETVPKRGYRFQVSVESFTKEEFIKLHTGNFKKADLQPLTKTPPTDTKTASAFGKYAFMILTALVMTGIGLSAYYFWQKDELPRPDKSAKTIAVMPFKRIGEESLPNRDLQKGLAESLAFDLNKIKTLKVAESKLGPNEAQKETDALELGKKLSAEMVLDGSYRYESEKSVQVNLRLLQTADGSVLLNETFSVKSERRFTTEKTLSAKIARKVFDKISALADETFVQGQMIGDEARKSYLTGQQILRNSELFRQSEGVEAFEKVTTLEPQWAKGYAKLAEASVLLHGGMPNWEKARQNAEKALAMDENLPEAHLAIGWYHQSKFDWANAERSFARAIELNPVYAEAYMEYGLLLDTRRKFAEAEKMLLKAIELKPFDPFFLSSLCQHYFYDKKPDRAAELCRETLNIDSNYSVANKNLFWIYIETGDYLAAFEYEYGELTDAEIERNLSAKLLKEGKMKDFWQFRIENRLKDQTRRYSPMTMAVFYAQLADRENTLKYLEEMAETSPIDMLYANPLPSFDFVRQDPRFIAILKKFDLEL